jgi:menaquinol-cytochrome c reductase cytochrome b/c subunit
MATEAREYEGPLRPLLIAGHERTLERVDLRPDDQVMAYPYIVVPALAVALGTVVVMTLCSVLVNAPLKELANPDHTPNPSKAPWYFMNLQELLLHMNPSLAGVIIPTNLVPLLLMAIPYIDRKVDNVGHWFMSRKGQEIALFSAVYTFIIGIALALFDSYFTLDPVNDQVPRSGGAFKAVLSDLVKNQGWPDWLVNAPTINGFPLLPYNDWLTGWVLPFGLILFFAVLLCLIVKFRWNGGIEEVMLALFTGFVFTYLLTTVTGAFFRGPSQLLNWPWAHPNGYNPIDDLL